MKIGITYLYFIFRYGYPPSLEDDFKGLPEVRRLGFRFLEMEGLGSHKLKLLYRHRKDLLAALDDNGLRVHNFCVVDPHLVSMNKAKRQKAFDGFKLGAELGDYLGTETLHLASYPPPARYLDSKPYQLGANGGYRFANHSRMRIPTTFDWERVWRTLVDSCQRCSDIAAQHHKTVIMEPRIGEVICSVDSLLRLIKDVDRPNFKANFDTGHFCAQRENVALALMKLNGQFANIHVADNNPVNTHHLPIGDGIIDWKEFFRLLQRLNYDGYLGLDLGTTKTLISGYRKSVEQIKSIAAELNLNIEI